MKGSSTAVVIKGLFSTLQLTVLCCIFRKHYLQNHLSSNQNKCNVQAQTRKTKW